MKKIQVIVFLLLLMLTSVAVAQESIVHSKVDAYDRNISLSIDGKEQTLTTKPLIIDGKIMIAVRDVSKILGKPVVWSNRYSLINFSSKAKVLDFPVELATQPVKPPTAAPNISVRYLEKMKVVRNVGPFYQLAKRKVAIAGTRYDHGVVVDLIPVTIETGVILQPGESEADESIKKTTNNAKAEAKILLDGNYSSLDGYIGVEDSTSSSKYGFIMRIYCDGTLRYEGEMIEPGDIATHLNKDTCGDLSEVKILKIEVESKTVESSVGNQNKVKVALANFKLFRKH